MMLQTVVYHLVTLSLDEPSSLNDMPDKTLLLGQETLSTLLVSLLGSELKRPLHSIFVVVPRHRDLILQDLKDANVDALGRNVAVAL